jgi:hypothetical protein
MNTALRWFVRIWAALAILVNLGSIAALFAAYGFWAGWGMVQEIWNPFNVVNVLAEIVLLSPALAAQYWLNKRGG